VNSLRRHQRGNKLISSLFSNGKWKKLLVVFIIYIADAIVFAIIYWALYISNTDHFVYNQDVMEQKLHELAIIEKPKFEKLIGNANAEFHPPQKYSGFNEYIVFPKFTRLRGNDSVKKNIFVDSVKALEEFDHLFFSASLTNWMATSMLYTSGDSLKILGKKYSMHDSSAIMRDFRLNVGHERGRIQREYALGHVGSLALDTTNVITIKFPIETRPVYSFDVGKDTLFIHDTSDMAEVSKQYIKLAQKNRLLTAWSYFDFVYFSIQTLTGGGFGDIVPNSTIIRACVVGQTISGIFILVFLLNVVIDSKAKINVKSRFHKRRHRLSTEKTR
jgi:hypothetical protein